MKFMMMVKHGDTTEMPPPALMEAMNRLTEEAVKSKQMIAKGGLAPLKASARVELARGKISAIDGPFSESKEVVGGFAILEYPSKEAAVVGAVEFMELHRKHWPGWEGVTEVRQIFGPEDFKEMCAGK